MRYQRFDQQMDNTLELECGDLWQETTREVCEPQIEPARRAGLELGRAARKIASTVDPVPKAKTVLAFLRQMAGGIRDGFHS